MPVSVYSTGPAIAIIGVPTGGNTIPGTPAYYTITDVSFANDPINTPALLSDVGALAYFAITVFPYNHPDVPPFQTIAPATGIRVTSISIPGNTPADFGFSFTTGGQFTNSYDGVIATTEALATNMSNGQQYALYLTLAYTPVIPPVVFPPTVIPTVLGTFEQKPKIAVDPSYAIINSDEGGGKDIPTDRIYLGKEAVVSGVLNRLNMLLLLNIMNPPVALGQNINGDQFNSLLFDQTQANGVDNMTTTGTIMGREQKTFDLWIVFPRNLTQVGLIPGYHFLAAFLGAATEIQAGSGDYKQLVIFQCQRKRMIGKSILTNSYYAAATVAIVAGGDFVTTPDPDETAPIQVGDQLQIVGGEGNPAIVQVESLDEFNNIATVSIVSGGQYTVMPPNPTGVIDNTRNVPEDLLNNVALSLTFVDMSGPVEVPNPSADLVLYDHLGLNGAPMNSLPYVFE